MLPAFMDSVCSVDAASLTSLRTAVVSISSALFPYDTANAAKADYRQPSIYVREQIRLHPFLLSNVVPQLFRKLVSAQVY